jgi:hypothetical protein
LNGTRATFLQPGFPTTPNLAFPIPDENGGKIMAGKIIKTPHDFAQHDFAKSCSLTLSASPQAHRS